MWEEFLNASLRENLLFFAALLGGLGGLNVLFLFGSLRRSKAASGKILELEDENRMFRSDFAKAQVRLKSVDPAIVTPQLIGQTRCEDPQKRIDLAKRYLSETQTATGAAALTLARHEILRHNQEREKSVHMAKAWLELAEAVDFQSDETRTLASATKALSDLPRNSEILQKPAVFEMEDTALQEKAMKTAQEGNMKEALFLALLCVEKARERTGELSENYVGALTTLAGIQSGSVGPETALQTLNHAVDITTELHGTTENAMGLACEVKRGAILGQLGKHKDVLALSEDLKRRALDVFGTENNPVTVNSMVLSAKINKLIGEPSKAKAALNRAIALHALVRSSNPTINHWEMWNPRDFL